MDSATIMTISTTLAGVIGGMYSGNKYGKASALSAAADNSSIASDTVDMLMAQVDHLEDVNDDREHRITELTARVNVLEDMVTQRAAVADVHDEVRSMRIVVDDIATKVGV